MDLLACRRHRAVPDAAAARKDLQPRLPKGPTYYLERFYYDTANAMTIHPLAALTKLVKPSQIVFGTDFPFLTAKDTAAGLREVGLSATPTSPPSSAATPRR